MILLDEFIISLYDYIVGKLPADDRILIRIHSRSLEQFGDISFPLFIKNWYQLIDKRDLDPNNHIFTYLLKESDIESGLNTILENLKNDFIKVYMFKVMKGNAHLYFERCTLFSYGIEKVLFEADLYGKCCLFKNNIELVDDNTIIDIKNIDLTSLRLVLIKDVTKNLLELTNAEPQSSSYAVNISINEKNSSIPTILCGPVINENGVKDTSNMASDLFSKRASDMRMMAQHRYRVNVKSSSQWNEYFSALGAASVTIEMLSNKPHKPIKVSLNDLSGANKGPSFIFYNCARLSVLLKEFECKVNKNVYPPLPEVNNINFSSLNQPEEWELLYVYIFQFPLVIKNCIKGIEKGIINPHHLITFLANLSSVFSIYYRRVRILTEPREHLVGTVHSRIYLLKALQHVFHNALRLINIEPIQYM